MKYCVEYYDKFRYNDVIDEVIYRYNDYKVRLVDEIKKRNWKEDQRIIIDIRNVPDTTSAEDVMAVIRMCQKIHSNIAVKVFGDRDLILKDLKSAAIPFFYSRPCNSLEDVYSQIKDGVKDIYVVERAGFELLHISAYCKKNDVNIRVYPNVAQCSYENKQNIPDACKFFIRPEDIETYEGLVDVFEFYGDEDRYSILYEIYQNGRWLGDLKELIGEVTIDVDNSTIVPYFAQRRTNCGQMCMLGKCNYCKDVLNVASSFKELDLVIDTPKNKEWINGTESYKKAVQTYETAIKELSAEIPEETGIHADSK